MISAFITDTFIAVVIKRRTVASRSGDTNAAGIADVSVSTIFIITARFIGFGNCYALFGILIANAVIALVFYDRAITSNTLAVAILALVINRTPIVIVAGAAIWFGVGYTAIGINATRFTFSIIALVVFVRAINFCSSLANSGFTIVIFCAAVGIRIAKSAVFHRRGDASVGIIAGRFANSVVALVAGFRTIRIIPG